MRKAQVFKKIEYNKKYYQTEWKNKKGIIFPQKGYLNYLIKHFLKKRHSVLEIGPGNFPQSHVKKTIFLEISKSAKKNLEDSGKKCVLGSVTKLPFNKEEFDVVLSFEVLEHIVDDVKAIKQINNVLKKKGKYILSVPINQRFWSKIDEQVGHTFRYEPRDLIKKLENNGFKIKKVGFRTVFSRRLSILLKNIAYSYQKIFNITNGDFLHFFMTYLPIKPVRVNFVEYKKLNVPKKASNIYIVCEKN